jgi:hypothetical protein
MLKKRPIQSRVAFHMSTQAGCSLFDLPGVKPGSDLEALFKAIGFVVVQWGHAEQGLDLMVASIFRFYGKHPLLKRRPRNLEPKVKFLRECFAKLPELQEFSAESEKLLQRFASAGTKRNDLVHGGIVQLAVENNAFRFLKIDVSPKEHHSIRSVVLDGADWPRYRKELLYLGKEGQSLAQRVGDRLKK